MCKKLNLVSGIGILLKRDILLSSVLISSFDCIKGSKNATIKSTVVIRTLDMRISLTIKILSPLTENSSFRTNPLDI